MAEGFFIYRGGRIYSVNYFDSAAGDLVVYVSNKPNNSFDTDVVFKYYGIPAET